MALKNTLITITIILLGFIALDFSNIQNFYHNLKGNQSFAQEDYQTANNYYQNNAFQPANIYNQANSQYHLNNFASAIDLLESLLPYQTENNLCFRIKHNLGNNYYKLGEQTEDIQTKKEQRESSINHYENALTIEEKLTTRENLEFVQKKLEELKEENPELEEQESQEQQNNDSQDWEQQEQSQTGEQQQQQQGNQTSEEENEKQNWQTNKENGEEWEEENSTSQTAEQEKKTLNEDQKRQLENYIKDLQKQEQQLQPYFNKKEQENNNDPFDQFFSDDPLGGSGEKDW